jgi:hypothetical protein
MAASLGHGGGPREKRKGESGGLSGLLAHPEWTADVLPENEVPFWERRIFRASASSNKSGRSMAQWLVWCQVRIRCDSSPGQIVVPFRRVEISVRICSFKATESAAIRALSLRLAAHRREQIPSSAPERGRGSEQMRQRSACRAASPSPASGADAPGFMGWQGRGSTLFLLRAGRGFWRGLFCLGRHRWTWCYGNGSGDRWWFGWRCADLNRLRM